MPSLRRIQLATPLVNRIGYVISHENSSCGPATARAVCSGRATARYLGTSSPKTIDTEVAISSVRKAITRVGDPVGHPERIHGRVRQMATSGSAR